MQISEIMTTALLTVTPGTTVREAASLLADHGITALPVLSADGALVGIVTEADLLRDRLPDDPRSHLRAAQQPATDPARLVADVMTRAVVAVPPGADAAGAARLMLESGIRALPVVDGHRLAGIVSRRDLLSTLLRDDASIAAEVRDRLDAFAGEAGRCDVAVSEGIVEMRGSFADDREASAILALTRTVPGVVRVHLHQRHSIPPALARG